MTNSTTFKNPEGASAQTPGQILKAARVSQGLSLEAVHEATKIPLDSLKAIEEGYKVRSLSPFYLKGFLKIYSKYLGVDISSVIPDASAPSGEEEADTMYPPKKRILSLKTVQEEPEPTLSEAAGRVFNMKVVKKILVGLIALIIVVVAFRLAAAGVKAVGGWMSKRSEQTETKKKASAKKSESKSSKSTKESSEKTAPIAEAKPVVQAPAASEKSQAPQNTTVSLTVRAVKDSWFQVKADGKTVFQSTLRAGKSESWTASDKIEVTGKNINQLEYEVNGRFWGALGKKERQAKKLTITRDGMTAQ